MQTSYGADVEDLPDQVLEALLGLRRSKGRLTPQKLAMFPVLVGVLGAEDLLDAFMMFRRELQRYVRGANRDEAAAALSLSVDAENVLDRLQAVAAELGTVEDTDQRTARRWSDRGMPSLARDFVYMARVQGRLGREMLSVEVHETAGTDLLITVDQVVQSALDVTVPKVTIWQTGDVENPEQIDVPLTMSTTSAANEGDYRMTRSRIELASEILSQVTSSRGVTISIAGRDAPMRTISFRTSWTPPDNIEVVFAAYRTQATIELAHK